MKMSKNNVNLVIQQVVIMLTEMNLGVVDLVSDNLSLEEWVSRNKIKNNENLKVLEQFLKEMEIQ